MHLGETRFHRSSTRSFPPHSLANPPKRRKKYRRIGTGVCPCIRWRVWPMRFLRQFSCAVLPHSAVPPPWCRFEFRCSDFLPLAGKPRSHMALLGLQCCASFLSVVSTKSVLLERLFYLCSHYSRVQNTCQYPNREFCFPVHFSVHLAKKKPPGFFFTLVSSLSAYCGLPAFALLSGSPNPRTVPSARASSPPCHRLRRTATS